MTEVVNGRPAPPDGARSTAELVQEAGEQIIRLVRDEIALARLEVTRKARRAGAGAGLFAGAALVGLAALGVLLAAAVAGLAEVLPVWAAALIVGGALLLLAGLMALAGRRLLRRAVPPVPAAMTREFRADVAAVSAAVRDRGRS